MLSNVNVDVDVDEGKSRLRATCDEELEKTGRAGPPWKMIGGEVNNHRL
jgi:hypothetical protein